jgi:hypothetical protein
LVGWFCLIWQNHHRILKREQDSWVDLKSEMEIYWASATLLGVHVNLPHLTE